ncbi:replication-associated recombination protein A [Thermodesulfobacteriota bacterium]
MDLFENHARRRIAEVKPLAERLRPQVLDDLVGQRDILGPGCLLRRAVEEDRLFSMILWGPPGCGKTTLARIMAAETRAHFIQISAVLSGVKEVRAVVKEAEETLKYRGQRTVLFVDEIHRFNKAQQDAFLPHVENGLLTLIGATTQNPSFEVIAPLLSRCKVVLLHRLSEQDLANIVDRALADPERGLGKIEIKMEPEALEFLVASADGDARRALNTLERTVDLVTGDAKGKRNITSRSVGEALQNRVLQYDKSGEEHYNLISAFHKSLRGGDPDAALYWLERMLSGGEDPLYVLRRMVRFASEDVGNADPQALAVVISALKAFQFLGSPEGELAIAQAAVYLATASKSNAVYVAAEKVKGAVARKGSIPVPMHLRNAPTRMMKDLGYGEGYLYPHDFQGAVVAQEFLPKGLEKSVFYTPSGRGYEVVIRERIAQWRAQKISHMKAARERGEKSS